MFSIENCTGSIHFPCVGALPGGRLAVAFVSTNGINTTVMNPTALEQVQKD